ncbi:hypothetical protein TNCV_2794491 [Trichonephila clavipes]|nr:hypothetical protein TNCV_2794491 [Trichonephila clavipes]
MQVIPASSLCHNSSNVVTGQRWWLSFSATHGQMFSIDEKSEERANQDSNGTPSKGVTDSIRTSTNPFGLPMMRTSGVHFVYPMAAHIITSGARPTSKFCGSSGVLKELPVTSHEFSMGDRSGVALGNRTVFVAARLALEMAVI